MNKLKLLIVALGLTIALSVGYSVFIDTTTASAAVKCDPDFKGGASGKNCPKGPNVPGYPGHTYHKIKVKVNISDPSGLVSGGSSDTIYCDCGRETAKCTVSAKKPSVSGRTGSWSGGSSKSAGGKNGGSSSVTFTYKLDPAKFDFNAKVDVSPSKVRPGETVTVKHSVSKSGKTNDTPRWSANPSRKGPSGGTGTPPDNSGSGTSGTTRFKVDENTPEGAEFCYSTTVRPADEKGGSDTSNTECSEVYIPPFQLTPETTTGNPSREGADGGTGLPATRTGTARTGTTVLDIDPNTPDGATFCYTTSVTPVNKSGGEETSEKACATVVSTPYNLIPSVTLDKKSPAEPGEPIDISYSIENRDSVDNSATVNWQTYGVKVNPGVSVNPIATGDLRTNSSAQSMVDALGGDANAELFDVDKYKNTQTFSPNSTTKVAGETFQVPNSTPIGTKYCFVVWVTNPTHNPQPNNRYSLATCVNVGKKSRINIYGGDMVVGRKFSNDSIAPPHLNSSIQTSLTSRTDFNKTFGSWTEYDAYAPGEINGFATASGLQGGALTANQDTWSKLTFVNTAGKFGTFTGSSTIGTIPDTARSVIKNLPIARPSDEITSLDLLSQMVIIAKNITINESVTTIDSWLVARQLAPGGSDDEDEDINKVGVIKTCNVDGKLTIDVCNRPLTVNGPVMANQLQLRRTGGEVTASEAQPAEVFNLRADTYLWIYNQNTESSRAITTYVRELPVRF
ncbi:MAG: hypothetical protein EOO17_00945 [Chloroflexi bacterium]|nr:MAG: hypothetical protein EOO17_00945 [Chloroflexota bacterium]